MSEHRAALLDWLACAYGGREQRAPRAARAAGDGLLERVAWLGTAGHVLDFDDTYLPGIAHLSAPTAPAAIALAAELDRSVGDALAAYAAGFEAMGALSRAHDLYARGWHPTAVCGAAGAAHAAARLLGLDEERTGAAERLALLQAGGLRAAFGSDGKSLQVGLAAAAGVHAARIAAGGATITARRARPRGGLRADVRRGARGRRTAGDRGELDQAVAVLPDEPQRGAGGGRGARRAGRLGGADRRRRPPGGPPRRGLRRGAGRAAGEVLDPVPGRLRRAPRRAGAGELRRRRPGGAVAARASASGSRPTTGCARPRRCSRWTARRSRAFPRRAARRRRRWTRGRWPRSASGWRATGSTGVLDDPGAPAQALLDALA